MSDSLQSEGTQIGLEKGCMRSIILMASLMLSAEQAGAEVIGQLPVEVANGPKVEVRGATAERSESGLYARGWVKRKLGRWGPIHAHLHIEGLDAQGATLQLLETQWRGNLSSRTRTLGSFNAKFDPFTSAQITRVRFSVQPGSRHDAKN